MHVFRYLEEKTNYSRNDPAYWFQNGFTKLARKNSNDPSYDFVNHYDKFIKSKHNFNKLVIKFHKYDENENFRNGNFYEDSDGTMHYITKNWLDVYTYIGVVTTKGNSYTVNERSAPDWYTSLIDNNSNLKYNRLKKYLKSKQRFAVLYNQGKRVEDVQRWNGS